MLPPPPPVAAFAGDPTAGCAPLVVGFSDSTTGAVNTWAWDFGDGGTSAVQHPSHEYTTPGVYDVTLIASGAGGSDTLMVAAYVTVDGPPTAAFSAADSSGQAPFEVTFSDARPGPTAGPGTSATASPPPPRIRSTPTPPTAPSRWC